MKTSSLVLFASAVCASLAFAADKDPAARQLQVYPKNLARQHVGSNLFLYNSSNQTYMPTEASAAWLDDDITTGWPVLAGKQYYLIALASPELVSNFSVSAKPAEGTVSLFAGDEPAVPGARSWMPLAQNVPFNSINEKKLDKPFTRFTKYVLIETDLANPGPLYSLYLYGEKPASIYDLRPREKAIDAHAVFGQINDHTAFNVNGLYAGSSISFANSPDGSLTWQKSIDDNPESGMTISSSVNEPGMVIKYGTPQSISRIALLANDSAKGKLEFFAIGENSSTTSLEGLTPTVTLVLDGSNARSGIDFPAINAAKLAVRWTPTTANDTVTIREIGSFGSDSLNDYEVGLKPEAVAAYDASGRDGKEAKGGKEGKAPVAEGPPDVADFNGNPYLPGALGFPPNISFRQILPLSP
jgi:hypothetical protein